MKLQKLINKFESKMETIEKLTDEISLICIDTRNILDKINEIADKDDIEEYPELDHFNNLDEEDIDEEDDKL
jgi:uncharacterized protein YoxC